jgi:hypothetical protein
MSAVELPADDKQPWCTARGRVLLVRHTHGKDGAGHRSASGRPTEQHCNLVSLAAVSAMAEPASSSCPVGSVVVAGGGGLCGNSKVLLSRRHGRHLLGHLLALSRRRGEE